MREAARGTNHIASSGGGIAILTFEKPGDAIDFTRAVHVKLAENGLPVLVGVDAGPVLLFENSRGPSGIAGDAINIASKLSEDVGRPGCISVTDRAAQQLGESAGHERFEIHISGITLRGIVLK
jgi:class 3 adenylate cyclase